MSATPTDFDQADFNDSYGEPTAANDEDRSPALSVLDLPTESEEPCSDWSGPRCEKCNAPMKSEGVTICRDCGWYASLGTYVEIDPNWEVEDEAETEPKPQPQVGVKMIPPWGWVIIASVLAVVVESVVARLVTPAGSSIRTTWSLLQLAAGVLAVVGCHVFNFLVQATEDADVGLFDLIIKPIKLWTKTIRRLPARLWVVDSAASGLTAAVMSLVVIGSIPYERFWDWGFTPPAKMELMGAVMDRVKQLDSRNEDGSLEDAINDFAGKGGVGDLEGDGSYTPPPPKRRHKADCVILGYQLDKKGRLNKLVLGTAHLGRLVYAGHVTLRLDSRSKEDKLLALLSAVRSHQRLIPVETTAIWVKPLYACRVSYVERKRSGLLTEIKWETFLGKLRRQE